VTQYGEHDWRFEIKKNGEYVEIVPRETWSVETSLYGRPRLWIDGWEMVMPWRVFCDGILVMSDPIELALRSIR